MTAGQVERQGDRSIARLADDWRRLIPTISPMLKGDIPFPDPAPFGVGAVLITDLEIHYQDVRGALGLPAATDGPALSLALATYCFGVDYRIRALDLPALAVEYAGKQRILGDGEPRATVAGDRFELLRAFGGRRSRKQILALDWQRGPGSLPAPHPGLRRAGGRSGRMSRSGPPRVGGPPPCACTAGWPPVTCPMTIVVPDIGLGCANLLGDPLPAFIDAAEHAGFRRITVRPYAFVQAPRPAGPRPRSRADWPTPASRSP